ncbi:MAG: glycerophosphodiester phosphodiesterase [Clostridia bacterium]|nr:glycerophosphodiester phosphodiesterase [Clostridia bacterium]
MNYWQQSEKNIYVAAHRGFSEKYPENTMEAFRAAIELGVDQIETDVRITKDGELVLIHDATVDRTTNGTGKVSEMTFPELRALDAGSKKDVRFAGAKIPTFIELMELVKDHPTMTLDIELKEYPTDGREELAYEVCNRVLNIVDAYGYTDRIVINSFSGKLNEYIHRKHGKKYRQHVFFPIEVMSECKIDPYSYAYCACMCGSPYMTKAPYFDKMRALGVEPWVGASVKDAAGVDTAIERGATLITCNNPDEVLALLREKGYHK